MIIAERAAGTGRADPEPAIESIRAAVSHRHGLPVSDALPASWWYPAHHQQASWLAEPAAPSTLAAFGVLKRVEK